MRHLIEQALRIPLRIPDLLWSKTSASSSADGAEDFWALRGVSFEVPRGQLTGLVGPNGAGKSLLLKILARITPPTEGFAEIRGRVGAVLEAGGAFHPDLTGRENLRLSAALMGIDEDLIRSRLDRIVRFAEVEPVLDVPVKRWSNGTVARLAFSVCYHCDCDVLLIDEVLAMGDEAFRERCIDALGTLADQGRTVLFVSHDAALVAKLCHRCLHVEAGRVLDDGPAYEVLTRYQGRARL